MQFLAFATLHCVDSPHFLVSLPRRASLRLLRLAASPHCFHFVLASMRIRLASSSPHPSLRPRF